MAVEIRIPQAGESVSRVLMGRWLKAEGDYVQRDEPLVEVETDKAAQEILATASGKLTKIVKKEGESAQVDEVVAILDDSVSPPADASGKKDLGSNKQQGSESTPSKPASGFVMPAADRLMHERNIQPGSVVGTGPSGRVLKEDVQRHVETMPSRPPSSAPVSVPNASPPTSVVASPASVALAIGERQEEVVEMTPLRESIARRLVSAQHNAALVTTFNEIDMTAVMQLRKDVQDTFQKKYGIKLGFMSFFVKAVVDALRSYPQINAEIRGNSIVYRNYFDIGVAVGGGKGLVVPIIRNAEQLGFAEIEKQIADLATRARDNKIKLEELAGGTFTISNGGVFGSLLSTPIVNPPQSGILGLHKIDDRPVARNGQVVIRPMMYVALTYDHRIVDGRESVGFLVRVKDCIENPTRMLIEV